MEQKILNRKTVLNGHVFDVQKVHFLLPDGRERDYDLVDHADAVTLLPVDAQGNVYLVTQYRIGSEGLLLELPAGVMDRGEIPEESARRELREEIGMDCRELIKLGSFFMAAGYSNEYMHVFLAYDLLPSPLEQDEDEFLTLSSLPLSSVYKKAWQGKIEDGKTLSALLLAQPYLEEKFKINLRK